MSLFGKSPEQKAVDFAAKLPKATIGFSSAVIGAFGRQIEMVEAWANDQARRADAWEKRGDPAEACRAAAEDLVSRAGQMRAGVRPVPRGIKPKKMAAGIAIHGARFSNETNWPD